jgi:hypothetical protein
LLLLQVIPSLVPPEQEAVRRTIEESEDTTRLQLAAREARSSALRADSAYEHALLAAGQNDAEGHELPAERDRRDSLSLLVVELDDLLDRSAEVPTAASFRALADARGIRDEGYAVLLRDSLLLLDKRRTVLESTRGSERSITALTLQINQVGLALREAAGRRRSKLQAEIEVQKLARREPIDTTGARVARDDARATAVTTTRALDLARIHVVGRGRDVRASDRRGRVIPPVAMLVASTVLAVILGFSATLLVEIMRPTIANTHEAEAIARCPSFVTGSDETHGSRAGMDPFRMLYLGITTDTVPASMVEIRGDDRSLTAIITARLALAAARDERATLVVDADAEGSAIAGYYRQRPDPGFTDVVAGVRLWREVIRTVGTSDGHSIDVVPGGSVRREALDADARIAARAEFVRFRTDYDFLVAAAPSDLAEARLRSLFERPTVLLCATIGVTTVASLRSTASRIRSSGANLHGVVLWNTEPPKGLSRNTLIDNALAAETRAPQPTTGVTPL